jgi:hypothetical protein
MSATTFLASGTIKKHIRKYLFYARHDSVEHLYSAQDCEWKVRPNISSIKRGSSKQKLCNTSEITITTKWAPFSCEEYANCSKWKKTVKCCVPGEEGKMRTKVRT